MVYLAIYLFLMRYVEDLCGLLIPVCTMDLVWLDFFFVAWYFMCSCISLFGRNITVAQDRISSVTSFLANDAV